MCKYYFKRAYLNVFHPVMCNMQDGCHIIVIFQYISPTLYSLTSTTISVAILICYNKIVTHDRNNLLFDAIALNFNLLLAFCHTDILIFPPIYVYRNKITTFSPTVQKICGYTQIHMKFNLVSVIFFLLFSISFNIYRMRPEMNCL